MGLLNDRQKRVWNQSGSKCLLGSIKSQPILYFTVTANYLGLWVSLEQFWNSWIVIFNFIKDCTQYKLFCGCNQSGSYSAQIYQKTAYVNFFELLMSFEFFSTQRQPWYTWGVTCSFIKYLAEMGLLNDRQKRGSNQSGSSLFLDLWKVSLNCYICFHKT